MATQVLSICMVNWVVCLKLHIANNCQIYSAKLKKLDHSVLGRGLFLVRNSLNWYLN